MIGFSNLKRVFVLGFVWFVVEFIFTFHILSSTNFQLYGSFGDNESQYSFGTI